VSIQLVDTGTATQVWADRVEFQAGDPGSDETTFSRRLTAKLRGALFNAEYRRAASGSAEGTSPVELVWRAMSVARTGTPEAVRDAGRLLDKAIALEPRLVPALTNRALNLVDETEVDPRADSPRLLRQADDLSSRALAIDGDDAWAWMTRAVVLGYGGKIEQALAAIALARRLDPTRKAPVVWHAWITLIAGEPDKSLAILDEARAVFPDEMALELVTACWANLDLGRYSDAAALCAKATARDADYLSFALLASAYANAAEPAKAAAAAAELHRLMPGFAVGTLKAKAYSTQPRYAEQAEAHFYAGLRRAGIPDEQVSPAR
jgi:tetratricopeptide (TPR) repeat protein